MSIASSSNAIYAVLGAVVAGSATLIAVVVKSFLDARMERERHTRELEKLHLQLGEQRAHAIADRRRVVFVSFLTATNAMYTAFVSNRRLRRQGGLDDAEYTQRLRAISSAEGQSALEEARLVADPGTCDAAARLWTHLRADPVVTGEQMASTAWVAWKELYWDLRGQFIARCRNELEGEHGTSAEPVAPPSDADRAP